MVVENFENFFDWLPSALWTFVLAGGPAALLIIILGYLVAAFRHGPAEAFYVVAQVLFGFIPDLFGTSLRRVFAIAKLAVKEALRRKVVLVTFALFAIALLFGGWFMNAGVDNPDRTYVNFVLWGTQLLILFMGMLLSAFSLPDDIKNRTIHTVVTKPVRSTEIVIGRILGFVALGTALLALMGLISFFFVWRSLSHTHQLVGSQDLSALAEIDPNTRESLRGGRVSENAILQGRTTDDSGHFHSVEIIEDVRLPGAPEPENQANVVGKKVLPDGKTVYQRVIVNPTSGHTHEVTLNKNADGSVSSLKLGPAAGYFRARVPIYASNLVFYDSDGSLSQRGINVGREWTYRGYVDGGTLVRPDTLSKAELVFAGVTPSKFDNPELMVIEMTLGVFRTYKANIEKRVIGSIQFESVPADPNTTPIFRSEVSMFETEEYNVQTIPVPRKLVGKQIAPDGTILKEGEFDLFTDFAADKEQRLKMILRCEDRNQYLGLARGDVYFRASDDLYWRNFIKGYIGIWCQLVVVVTMGVAFSTFLSAPVGIILSIVVILFGFISEFVRTMAQPDVSGGGPIESFWRLITQKNMEVELEPGLQRTLMEQGDTFLINALYYLTFLAPDFKRLNFSSFLTYGYSVDANRLGVALAISIGFCIWVSILGYFCLKTREIAK
jgi:ABC-type transport system involved in multi-copper enzyme maturation permease subunit